MSANHAKSLASSTKPPVNSEASEMSIALQARSHIGAIVQFVAPSLPMKSALPRVAAYVGINTRRARALWNKEARAVLASEIHALEAARARIAERIITKEISDYANTLEVHASRLAFTDADFHGPEIARLRRLAQRARNFLDDGEA
jgi:hypothetical protein